jgi:hypothetical protein
MRDLKKELVGEESLIEQTVSQYATAFAEKSTHLRQQNEMACQEFCQQMLVQLFSELDQIKQQFMDEDFNDCFRQVDYGLRELATYYEQNCVEFPEKRLYLAEAKTQFMAEILSMQSTHISS